MQKYPKNIKKKIKFHRHNLKNTINHKLNKKQFAKGVLSVSFNTNTTKIKLRWIKVITWLKMKCMNWTKPYE
jgi:hypothetical protein